MIKLSFLILFVVCVNLSWAEVTTTDSPSQDTTLEALATENFNEIGTTEAASLDNDSTVHPEINNETGSVVTTEDQTEPPKPVESASCSAAGLRADDSNCQLYHECTSTESGDGSLHSLNKCCPERHAFNSELGRCSRDISSCQPPIQCMSKGVIADPEGNSSYYLCQPRFNGSGFHIFRVYCNQNEVFHPSLGLCFTNLSELLSNGFANVAHDIVTVKAEIKQLKKDYKLAIKKEKEQKKTEEKLQKKEKKLQKQALKLEAANFKCQTEGNFPSQLGDNFYLACINSKNKVAAIPLECSLGTKFNSKTGACEKNANSEEDNEDSSGGSEKQD